VLLLVDIEFEEMYWYLVPGTSGKPFPCGLIWS